MNFFRASEIFVIWEHKKVEGRRIQRVNIKLIAQFCHWDGPFVAPETSLFLCSFCFSCWFKLFQSTFFIVFFHFDCSRSCRLFWLLLRLSRVVLDSCFIHGHKSAPKLLRIALELCQALISRETFKTRSVKVRCLSYLMCF